MGHVDDDHLTHLEAADESLEPFVLLDDSSQIPDRGRDIPLMEEGGPPKCLAEEETCRAPLRCHSNLHGSERKSGGPLLAFQAVSR